MGHQKSLQRSKRAPKLIIPLAQHGFAVLVGVVTCGLVTGVKPMH
jgi:hypothetical protein